MLVLKNEARDIVSCVMWIHNFPCVTMCKCQCFIFTLWSELHVKYFEYINKTLVSIQICETRDFEINFYICQRFWKKFWTLEVIWDVKIVNYNALFDKISNIFSNVNVYVEKRKLELKTMTIY